MNRPRVPGALLRALSSMTLIAGLLAGTTGATLGADSRQVYHGDLIAGNGRLVTSPVTAGGVFVFNVVARNDGTQALTHARLGLGTGAATRTAADFAASVIGPIPDGTPSLPAGATILSATLDGAPCAFDATGATCDVGSFPSGDDATASFVVRAPASAVNTWIWTSFRVAENVNDVGANRNTFFADAALAIGPTNSNGISTFLSTDDDLAIGTAGQTPVSGDPQVTYVEVPGAKGGLVSLFETNGPTGCSPKCIGQTVSANVRNGAALSPYLRWTLVINQVDVVPSKGGVIHTLDNGDEVTIANEKSNACSATKTTNCIEQFVVNKKTGTTTIIFRTPSNGAVRGFG